MKTTLVVVNIGTEKTEFSWLGQDNLGDKLLLKAFVLLKFKGANYFWAHDERARGWELVMLK